MTTAITDTCAFCPLFLWVKIRACAVATFTRNIMPESAKEKEIFFEHLRRAGFKKTTQRELILEVFLKTEGHLSAEDLYNIVKVEDPTVGFTTVYRTLKLLAECGLAREERL